MSRSPPLQSTYNPYATEPYALRGAQPDGHYQYPSERDQFSYPLANQPTSYPMLHKDPSYTSDVSERTVVSDNRGSTMLISSTQEPTDVVGFWRNLLPDSLACRLYLAIVLLETIVDIALEADILAILDSRETTEDDLSFGRLPVYLVVFGLAHLFQLLLALDAVHARNTLQFIFLTIFNLLLMVYATIQRTEILQIIPSDLTGASHLSVNALTTIIPIIISIAEIAYVALGWKIYTEFGWQVYKRLGADRSVKRMYMHFQIFACLIKFDVFFWIGFSVQWIFLVLKSEQVTAEYYLTIVALPFTLGLLFLGHLGARYERMWLIGVFMAGCVAASVYFVYKLYKIIKFKDDPALAPVFRTLTVFTALAIVLVIITFTWACIVARNFGRGLKARVAKHSKQPSVHLQMAARRTSNFEMGVNPHRLSID